MAILFQAGTESLRTSGFFMELGIVTICFWYKPDSVTGNNRIFGTDTNYEGRLNGSNLLHEVRQNVQPTTTTVYATSAWYHVALLANNTQKAVYVNGVADVPLGNYATSTVGNDTALSIGSSTWNASQGMFGQLEDFRVYARLLSAAEINLIFASKGKDKIINRLQHWWTLTGPPGTTVSQEKDLMGNLNLNTVVGTPSYQTSLNTYNKGGY